MTRIEWVWLLRTIQDALSIACAIVQVALSIFYFLGIISEWPWYVVLVPLWTMLVLLLVSVIALVVLRRNA